MTDIVERLREIDQSHQDDPSSHKALPFEHYTICGEAAGEIERLRTALGHADEALTDLPTNQDCEGVRLAQKIIKDATAGEQPKRARTHAEVHS